MSSRVGSGAGVVIVGGSVAGVRTARALRERGYVGRVRVVEAEDEAPYDKPPLSKAALESDPHVPLITADEAAELDIELLLGCRAAALEPERGRVVLEDATTLSFEHLVIATGLTPRPAPYDVDGVHVLRTLADARGLRAALVRAQRVLVLGAGFIGAEVASLARAHGLDVTIVDQDPVPMARLVGVELGGRLAQLHRTHGVDTRFGVGVVDLVRDGDGYRAILSDGVELRVDVVVAGIGSLVNVGWLAGSGLPLEDGVGCDETGGVLGFPGIHAVGDAARWAGVRVEHWTNAIEQAVCVAQRIVEPQEERSHSPAPYVWSDQYDWRIQLVGSCDPVVAPAITEQADPYRLAAVWHHGDGSVRGAVTVNWTRESLRLRKAVAGGGAS